MNYQSTKGPFKVKSGKAVRRPRSIYPFEQMNVGDYFDAPDDMGSVGDNFSKSARRHSILGSARNYTKAHNRHARFTTALIYEDGQNIVRCWRREDAESVGEYSEQKFKVVRGNE